MDIEDRARKWVSEYLAFEDLSDTSVAQALQAAYLAGSAQTQKDYTVSQAVEPVTADPFGGHEFHYEGHTDLFRCIRCHGYWVTLRKGDAIEPCAGQPPADAGPIEVNAW